VLGASSELRAEEPPPVLRPNRSARGIIEGRFAEQLTTQKFGPQCIGGVEWRRRRWFNRVVIAKIYRQGQNRQNRDANLSDGLKTGYSHQWNICAG
jgi:hypothetical protein